MKKFRIVWTKFICSKCGKDKKTNIAENVKDGVGICSSCDMKLNPNNYSII